MRLHRFLLFILLLNLIVYTAARGGGGRGGRGRGRGRSGSRGGVRAQSSIIKSSVRGSSSFNGGVRTGTSGFKVGSSSSATSFGSSGFRVSMFGAAHHSSVHRKSTGHPFVVVAATMPMFYDNRNYYWSYNTAMVNNTVTRTNIICEYVFGSDDGELQNITFKNGTSARAVYFGCQGMVDCCGMYCCHDFHQVFELIFLFGFVVIMLGIAYYAKKHEPNHDKLKDGATIPLNSVSTKPGGKSTQQSKPKPKTSTATSANSKSNVHQKRTSVPTTSAPLQKPQAPYPYGFISSN